MRSQGRKRSRPALRIVLSLGLLIPLALGCVCLSSSCANEDEGFKASHEGTGVSEPAVDQDPVSLEDENGGDESQATETAKRFQGRVIEVYENEEYDYRVGYPRGWQMTEGPVSYGYRVEWNSPDGSMRFLVDSSYTGGTEDPCDYPRQADSSYRREKPGYQRIALEPLEHGGGQACLWEYRTGSNSTLDLFVEGERYGYAILFEAPAETYNRVVEEFKESILFEFVPDREFKDTVQEE